MANSTLKNRLYEMNNLIKQYDADNKESIRVNLEEKERIESELRDIDESIQDANAVNDLELAMRLDDEKDKLERKLRFVCQNLERIESTPEISKEDCENNTQIIFECVDAINQEKAIEVLKYIDALAKIRDEINDELTIANETRVGMHTIARKEKINPIFYGLRDKDYFVKTILNDIVNNDRIKTLRDIASGHFKNKRF